MASLKKTKIILADDNLVFIEGLSHLLSTQSNFEVLEKCKDGVELANSDKLHDANLLLIDIEMPNMNGIEAAKKVNFQFPQLPMIAMTMHADNVFLNEMLSAGFQGFIHKPDVAKILFNIIDKVLAHEFEFPDNLKL